MGFFQYFQERYGCEACNIVLVFCAFVVLFCFFLMVICKRGTHQVKFSLPVKCRLTLSVKINV